MRPDPPGSTSWVHQIRELRESQAVLGSVCKRGPRSRHPSLPQRGHWASFLTNSGFRRGLARPEKLSVWKASDKSNMWVPYRKLRPWFRVSSGFHQIKLET